MSWSFSAIGKPLAILAKAEKDLNSIRCAEPEESIKDKVLEIIKAAMADCPGTQVIQIKAGGSQHPLPNGKYTNSLSIEIAPIYGFVE